MKKAEHNKMLRFYSFPLKSQPFHTCISETLKYSKDESFFLFLSLLESFSYICNEFINKEIIKRNKKWQDKTR